MNTATLLDHVGICATDPRPVWAAYEALGFTLSPFAQQSGGSPPALLGTGNRCAMLRRGYVELLGIVDPTLFDNGLSRFLDRYQGQHIVAFAMADAEANLARLRAAGLDIPGIAWLERPVEAPDGPRARFARLPFPDAPEGRLQLIQHLTPELLWQERWLTHANHAVALEESLLIAASPAESAARLSRLCGLPLLPDPAGGFALPLPQGGRVRILPPEALEAVLPGVVAPGLPFLAGVTLRTDDGNAAASALPVRPVPGGLMVEPQLAGGTALVFAA
ncbi:glyoxalase-like protein [Humitalea rosea]|uniref:Glyoxalase-like protein n=1 Tax=Humitalea rosea TaxID=990373 RepID=A0A2W7IEJ3_9PROT|nr:VOC family protein [Humitalea rosea]PZW44889.1 glyoxalase-like protein [Humitalea rosea]